MVILAKRIRIGCVFCISTGLCVILVVAEKPNNNFDDSDAVGQLNETGVACNILILGYQQANGFFPLQLIDIYPPKNLHAIPFRTQKIDSQKLRMLLFNYFPWVK